MKKKIRLLLFVFTFFLLTGCGSNKVKTIDEIKRKGVITVVTNAIFYPFEYYEGPEIKGVDIDIANEIAKDLGVKLEILDMNFDGVVVSVATGKGDFVAAGLTIDPQKEKAISFSDAYISVPQSIVTKKDDESINELKDIKDKRMGAQIGTTSDLYLRDEIKNGFLKDSLTKVIAKKEYLDLVIDLRNNRLDAIALDGYIARQLTKKNHDLKFFDRDHESYALAVKKGNDELLFEINKTIKRLVDSNKINDFYKNHTEKVGNAH